MSVILKVVTPAGSSNQHRSGGKNVPAFQPVVNRATFTLFFSAAGSVTGKLYRSTGQLRLA